MNKFDEPEELFEKYLRNECTVEEIKFLLEYVHASENEHDFKRVLDDFISKRNDEPIEDTADNELDERLSALRNDIKFQIRNSDDQFTTPLLVRLKPLLYAASIVLVLSLGIWLGLSTNDPGKKSIVPVAIAAEKAPAIQPGGNNAVLTLANKSQIILNHIKDGLIEQRGKIAINKNINGVLEVSASGPAAISPELLDLQTPNGGQYQVILSDKTKVWLNSGSSIRFPPSFGIKERRVEITGEVYFEVAKATDASNQRIPFVVTAVQPGNVAKQEITVLGTHFNVNAYGDEKGYRTTLLEGSVMVKRLTSSGESKPQLLKPGQQALVEDGIIVSNVDVNQAIAWKKGLITFVDADIKSIMRQIKRWYNVDVVYSGPVSERLFNGTVSRNVDLNKLLDILKLSDIHVKVEGKTLTVLSQ